MRPVLLCIAFALSFAPVAHGGSARGSAKHWAGVVQVHGQSIPVRLSLSAPGKNGAVNGNFENGNELSSSSSGSLVGEQLELNFNYFARKLTATVDGDTLRGTFGGTGHGSASAALELHPEKAGKPATRFVAREGGQTGRDPIGGDWEIAVKSPKGESAWTLRVAPFGGNGEINAVILRIDGDTGGLYGGLDVRPGEYRVSRFAASGAALYSLKPQADGTLLVTNLLHEQQAWVARRAGEARRQKLAPPTKATEQTGLADPSKPLEFSAPNLAGVTVTNADPQFRGKVVIVAIGGSWCPNCHDEAPLLVDFYNRYHAQGLEIVNLSFEEEEQLKNPERLRAFVTKYGIPYTVLLAGTPEQLAEKVPQGKNLNCWPTSFIVGRDGLVKEVHAGFSGPATGVAYTNLKSEMAALIEKLLAEKQLAQN